MTSAGAPLNVLLISIAFPPKNDPEALQAGRYFRYLTRATDLAVDVVTSRAPTLWMPEDPSLGVVGHRQRIELPIFEPRLLAVGLTKVAARWVLLPDTRLTFHLQKPRVVAALRQRPDVVYSRGYPLSSQVLARKVARHYRVPWVMHLSDPWVAPGFDTYRGLARWFNHREEARCFDEAHRITFASPRIRGLYEARYPRHRAKYADLPNVYDPADVSPARSHVAGPRLRIVYTGTLGGTRSLTWLWDALTRVVAADPALAHRFELHVAGSADAANRRLLASGAFPHIHDHGVLSFPRARQLQASADLLLIIDNRLPPADAVYLPSKLLDYLTVGSPMMAITTRGSPTEQLLQGRWPSFAHEDTRGLVGFLGDTLRAFNPGAAVPRRPSPPPEHAADLRARELHQILMQAARGTP